MPGALPLYAVLIYLLLILGVQTAIDIYFTRPYLPGDHRRRGIVLGAANTVGLLVTVLLVRLTLPFQYMFLLGARERGSMAVAVLLVILEYFLWAAPFIGIRGAIVSEWGMSDQIREKKQAWWSYAMVGAIASVLLAGPLYIAYTIVMPLMGGVEEAFTQ
jgi:hypothetical protein